MSDLTVDDVAEISWAWTYEFFLETSKGNFVWNSPDYDGDNTITGYEGSLEDFIESRNIKYVRDKGSRRIGDYCGEDVIFR